MAKGTTRKPSKSNQVRNKSHRVSKDTQQALHVMRELQWRAQQQRQKQFETVGAGIRETRVLNDRLMEWVRTEVTDLDDQIAAINKQFATTVDKARAIRVTPAYYDIGPQDVDPNPAAPARDGVFWWASTDWHTERGINALFLTDGLHFFNGISYDDDPTSYASVGAVAHFELQAARRPPSNSGRYASSPIVQLFGKIEGFTGYWHWLWAADDKWCKCWLHLKQTAIQMVPHDFGIPRLHAVEQPVVLASREQVITLLEEENESRFKDAFLAGFTPMPPIEFGLLDPNLSVWVQLEIRFDIQLEGWSQIYFSPENNSMGSVVLQHPQWSIQAL